MEGELFTNSDSLQASMANSAKLLESIQRSPQNYRVLTGDRPTGSLHIGHLFGSLENRVRLKNLGVEIFIVIADYQVLTDRESAESISENIYELVLDYLSVGLDPEDGGVTIFPHSQIPELNQLLLPFLFLVTGSELDRNPTVKEEIRAANLKSINAGMYVYPVHQAADILFCKGNVVPVGKDQLPHLEFARTIARRFNGRFSPKAPVFPEPAALLSDTPVILGVDAGRKMSKSQGNAILLKSSPDEVARQLKKATTDSTRHITYDPENRKGVANLLKIASLVTSRSPEEIASEIGDGGSSQLKGYVTDALNCYLEPIRMRRKEHEGDRGRLKEIIKIGVERAREEAISTLNEVRSAMNMSL